MTVQVSRDAGCWQIHSSPWCVAPEPQALSKAQWTRLVCLPSECQPIIWAQRTNRVVINSPERERPHLSLLSSLCLSLSSLLSSFCLFSVSCPLTPPSFHSPLTLKCSCTRLYLAWKGEAMNDLSNLKALNPHDAWNEYFAYIHATMIQFEDIICKQCLNSPPH